jgi:MFS family permease
VNIIKTFQALEPEKQRNLLTLLAVGLFFWTSITTLLPTLPAYVEDIGGTAQQVGLVMGCFAIGLLLSRNWLGTLADKRSRKLVVAIGTFVAGIAPLGYFFVHSIPPLMAIRAFHGISIAAFTTGYSALVVDLSPVKQRGELIGYMSLAVPIGMAIGPALGGFLQYAYGYGYLFLVSAALGWLGLLLTSQVEEERHQTILPSPDLPDSQRNRSWGELLTSPSLLVPSLVLLLIGLVFGTLASFLPILIRAIKLDLNAGLFYTAAAIASFAVRILAGKASDFYGRGLFITVSLVCYTLSMILIAFVGTPQGFILAAILEGSGGGLLIPMMLALISDRCYAQERGRVFAFCTTGFDLGIALAGPGMGFLSTFWGYRGMFVLAAILSVLSLLLFLSQSNKNLSHSLRFALGKAKDGYALD